MRRTERELIQAFTDNVLTIRRQKRRRRWAWIGAVSLLLGLLVAGDVADAGHRRCTVTSGGRTYTYPCH